MLFLPVWWQVFVGMYVAAIIVFVAPSGFATHDVRSDSSQLYFHNVQHSTKPAVIKEQAFIINSHPASTIVLVEPLNDLIEAVSVERGDPAVYHPHQRGLSCAVWHASSSQVLSATVVTSDEHDPLCHVSLDEYELFVVHPLPPFGFERAKRQQMTFAALKNLINQAESQGRGWLVVGDFNSSTYSPVFRHYFKEYEAKRNYSWQWPTPLTIPIDYAFGTVMKDAKKLPTTSSDHNALGVEI